MRRVALGEIDVFDERNAFERLATGLQFMRTPIHHGQRQQVSIFEEGEDRRGEGPVQLARNLRQCPTRIVSRLQFESKEQIRVTSRRVEFTGEKAVPGTDFFARKLKQKVDGALAMGQSAVETQLVFNAELTREARGIGRQASKAKRRLVAERLPEGERSLGQRLCLNNA